MTLTTTVVSSIPDREFFSAVLCLCVTEVAVSLAPILAAAPRSSAVGLEHDLSEAQPPGFP
jgi:hypothetical protein